MDRTFLSTHIRQNTNKSFFFHFNSSEVVTLPHAFYSGGEPINIIKVQGLRKNLESKASKVQTFLIVSVQGWRTNIVLVKC